MHLPENDWKNTHTYLNTHISFTMCSVINITKVFSKHTHTQRSLIFYSELCCFPFHPTPGLQPSPPVSRSCRARVRADQWLPATTHSSLFVYIPITWLHAAAITSNIPRKQEVKAWKRTTKWEDMKRRQKYLIKSFKTNRDEFKQWHKDEKFMEV